MDQLGEYYNGRFEGEFVYFIVTQLLEAQSGDLYWFENMKLMARMVYAWFAPKAITN